MGVNLSPSQVRPELPAIIRRTLAESGCLPSLLEIEVTEHSLLDEDSKTIEWLQEIRRMGVRIAFDDFGTGYASLSYLKRFPLDQLKIDRSFVRDFGSNKENTAIVTAVVELAKRLGLSTVAEGIEDEYCAKMLTELGCDEGQGYYFAKPMPADQVRSFFNALAPKHDHATAA